MGKINNAIILGFIASVMIGTSFCCDIYRVFRGDQSIWWTNQTRPLPLEETKDNFELFIGGKLFQQHLSEGSLFGTDKNGKQFVIAPKDVAVRLNNWDKVKASILPHASISGSFFGMSVSLLWIGFINFFRERKTAEGGGG